MHRSMRLIVIGLLFVVSFGVFGQEDTGSVELGDSNPCSASSMIERVDASYTEYQVTRDTDDALTAFNDAQNFHDTIGVVLDECRNIVELAATGVVEVGSGTFDDPYAFDYFGDTGAGYLLKVSRIVRPANQYVSRYATQPSQTTEYVAFVVDVQCISPEEDFCEFSYRSFELTGDNNVVYEYSSSSSLDVKLRPGGEGNGSVFFLIESDDANLMVMFKAGYYGDLVVFRGEPAPGQVVEEPESAVLVTGTRSINVRGGPGTSYRVVGSFQNGQQATAVGRNQASTWIQLDSGWVFAQLVRVDGNVTSLPVTG